MYLDKWVGEGSRGKGMRVLTLFGYILKRAPGQPATTCQNQVLGINLSYGIVIMGEIVNSVDKN